MATRYSLVVPVYRNELAIPELVAALVQLNAELGGALEVVLVVDGSPDRSLEALARTLPASGLDAKVLELARNFGAFAAIRAGLIEASGPYFAVMAAEAVGSDMAVSGRARLSGRNGLRCSGS